MHMSRLMFAVVLAIGLAFQPVAAAMAMANAAQAEIGMAAPSDDCPCCKSMQTDACPLACCHMLALEVQGPLLAKPQSMRFEVDTAAAATAISLRPDPPPPRL